MKLKQKYLSIIPALVLFLALSNSSCSEDNLVVPPPDKEQFVKLSTLAVTCTEAFIKVSANDTLLPLSITLSRDDSPVFSFNLTKNDTTVTDTNLLPGGSYNYNAAAVINGEEWTGEKLKVQTLALTSHNFTWQKFEFGTGASSILRDVAIIDENNIWAVGEIYADTTGQAYNAVHWDGTNWELKRIYYYGACSAVMYPPLKAVWAFDENSIVITNGGSIGWFDGTTVNLDCGVNPLLTGAINKIWGSSSNDLYVVGNGGTIAHYQNGSWSKIESGTDLNIHDINGFINPFTGETEILCVADDKYFIQTVQVIRIIENNTTELLNNSGLGIAIGSVWFVPDIRYHIVGNGLYEKTYKDTSTWVDLNQNKIITQYFMESIRGNGLNDIIVVGAFGEVIHFNGISWASIKNAETTLNNGSYYRVAVKGNTVAAVGYDDGKGVILLGHHL